MYRSLAAAAAVLATGLLLVACAPSARRVASPARPAPPSAPAPMRCDEAAGEATMGSASAARYFARANLERNLGPSRDYLLSQGSRRLRVVARNVQCKPYALGGMTRCVASARLCSR